MIGIDFGLSSVSTKPASESVSPTESFSESGMLASTRPDPEMDGTLEKAPSKVSTDDMC